MKHLLSFVLCSVFLVTAKAELIIPRDSVPEDHLAWFGLRGAVQEVTEYDYNNYGKKIWRFDTRGRLTEYYEYTHPFFENGGCVFGLWAHYRYAYNEQGKIIFEETYRDLYATYKDELSRSVIINGRRTARRAIISVFGMTVRVTGSRWSIRVRMAIRARA